jgi:hypothetical protein
VRMSMRRSDPSNLRRDLDCVPGHIGLELRSPCASHVFVVRPESQISIKTEDSPSEQELERHDGSTAAEGLVSATDGIAIRPESQISTGQELERRREIVRQVFNDFWRSADDKPVTFAERLNRAEGYINERLAARGEAWQLDPATRKQLGLPPNLS